MYQSFLGVVIIIIIITSGRQRVLSSCKQVGRNQSTILITFVGTPIPVFPPSMLLGETG